MDWLFQNLSQSATDVQLEEFFSQCCTKKNNSLLFMTILQSFPPEFISARAIEFIEAIANTCDEGITKASLFRQLGNILSLFPPPEDLRLKIFNAAWKTIQTITNVDDYISCIELWSAFISFSFNIEVINKFFGEIATRTSSKRAFERLYNELQGIFDKILSNTTNFHGVLTMVCIFLCCLKSFF